VNTLRYLVSWLPLAAAATGASLILESLGADWYGFFGVGLLCGLFVEHK